MQRLRIIVQACRTQKLNCFRSKRKNLDQGQGREKQGVEAQRRQMYCIGSAPACEQESGSFGRKQDTSQQAKGKDRFGVGPGVDAAKKELGGNEQDDQ